MDKRINYRIVLDTETAPFCSEPTVNPANMACYDIGWAVVDKSGNIYRTRSFVNADIFCYERQMMQSAYYANKIDKYWEDIHNGSRILASFRTIRLTFLQDLKEFNITEVYAHNARFDYGALNATMRWLTKSKYRYFYPSSVKVCDTLKMSREILGKMSTYIQFCTANGYVTSNGKPRFTAEVIYRYLIGSTEFEESHTALEDVQIEAKIMAYCFRQHRPMTKRLWAR